MCQNKIPREENWGDKHRQQPFKGKQDGGRPWEEGSVLSAFVLVLFFCSAVLKYRCCLLLKNAVSLFSQRGCLCGFESVHIREGGRDPRVGMWERQEKKKRKPVEKQEEIGWSGEEEEEMWEENQIQTCFLLISWNTMRIPLPLWERRLLRLLISSAVLTDGLEPNRRLLFHRM